MRRCARGWIISLVVALGCAIAAASKTNAGSVVLVGRIASKSGPINARVWAITLSNSGSATANSAQINGLSLTQIGGSACTPVITTSFPLAIGAIAPASSASGLVTIDFTGCPNSARFTVNIPYSADAGAESGAIVRHNVFQ